MRRYLVLFFLAFTLWGCAEKEIPIERTEESVKAEVLKLNTEAGDLIEEKKYEEAIAKVQEARALVGEYFMIDHPYSLQVLNNLAGLYYRTGNISASTEVSESILKALKSGDREGREDQILSVAHSLAQMHEQQGSLIRAEELLIEGLDILKEKDDIQEQEKTLNKLATFKFNQKKFPEAEKYYEELLVLKEQQYGEGDPKLGKTYKNVAFFYKLMGNVQRAEELEKKVVVETEFKRKSLSFE